MPEAISDLPDSYLSAIGKVCVQWNWLDATADLCIRKLLDFDLYDPKPLVLTAHMSWPMKMDILRSLVEEYKSGFPHLVQFNQVSEKLKKAQTGRNRIVHSMWTYDGREVYALRATARGHLKTTTDTIKLSEILTVIDDIGDASTSLHSCIIPSSV